MNILSPNLRVSPACPGHEPVAGSWGQGPLMQRGAEGRLRPLCWESARHVCASGFLHHPKVTTGRGLIAPHGQIKLKVINPRSQSRGA